MTLDDMMEVLQAASTAKHRDDCGDACIKGKAGMIYAQPEGFYLYCDPGSARMWTFAKRALSFCKLTQDGDEDGFMLLDRLPTSEEGDVIRERLVIRKRPPPMSEAHRRALIEAGAKHAFQPRRLANEGGELPE